MLFKLPGLGIRSKNITFVGAGNMTRSLVSGLIKTGYSPTQIMVSNRGEEKLQHLTKEFGVKTAKNNSAAVEHADVVVMAVKPQVIQTVARETAKVVQTKKPLVISLVTGIRIADLDRWLGGNVSIVRSMPNTPTLVGMGSTALFANTTVTPDQKKLAEEFFNTSGKFVWLDNEVGIDVISPLIGCGPAFVFSLIEALEQSAIKRGVKPETAKEMALYTVYGAVTMAYKTNTPIVELRKRITTPNGATEKALQQLTQGRFFQMFDAAFEAAEQRCKELGDSLGVDVSNNSGPRAKL